MRSFLAALRTLNLPYGRSTGARIVLDGVNGIIRALSGTGNELRINPTDTPETAFPALYFYSDGKSTDPAVISGSAVRAPSGMFLESAKWDTGLGYENRAFLSLTADEGGPRLAMTDPSFATRGGFVTCFTDKVILGHNITGTGSQIEVYQDRAELDAPFTSADRLTSFTDIPVPRMASGSENITPTDPINPPWGTLGDANRGIVSVTFPAGRFATAPRVVAMVASEFAVHYAAGSRNITETGFDLVFDSSGTTARDVHWIAIEDV